MGLHGVHLITDDYRRPPYCGPLGGAGMAPLAANRGPRPFRTAITVVPWGEPEWPLWLPIGAPAHFAQHGGRW